MTPKEECSETDDQSFPDVRVLDTGYFSMVAKGIDRKAMRHTLTCNGDWMLLIRMAKKEDLNGILSVEKESFEEYLQYTPSEMYYLLFEANSEGWVAEIDGNIVGYYILLFRKNTRVGRLYSIAVAKSWRGKGIGKMLLRHAEEQVAKRGCKAIHLEVKTTNENAIALYKKNGYVQIGFLPNYYKEGVHGIRMEKRLSH